MDERADRPLGILCEKEVELLDRKYLVYLKEVPTRIAVGGTVLNRTVRAFIKEAKSKEAITKLKGGRHARPTV